MRPTIVTYEPDNSLKKGYRSLVSEIIRELHANQWLTFQLFKRDFFSMYKQSFIGIFWVAVLPLVNVATFLLLSRSGVFNVGEISVPYPLYAVLGLAFWQVFSTGIIACANSLSNAGEMVMRINFSKKSHGNKKRQKLKSLFHFNAIKICGNQRVKRFAIAF